MAVVGENGAGKSTLLQCAASVYRQPLGTSGKASFASDFFPDTPWEKVQQAAIRFAFRQGKNTSTGSIRKPTNRWRGNPERPSRDVLYIDLTRIQPAARELLHELPVGAHDTPVQLPAIGFRLNGDALAPTRPPRLVGQDNDRWLSRR